MLQITDPYDLSTVTQTLSKEKNKIIEIRSRRNYVLSPGEDLWLALKQHVWYGFLSFLVFPWECLKYLFNGIFHKKWDGKIWSYLDYVPDEFHARFYSKNHVDKDLVKDLSELQGLVEKLIKMENDEKNGIKNTSIINKQKLVENLNVERKEIKGRIKMKRKEIKGRIEMKRKEIWNAKKPWTDLKNLKITEMVMKGIISGKKIFIDKLTLYKETQIVSGCCGRKRTRHYLVEPEGNFKQINFEGKDDPRYLALKKIIGVAEDTKQSEPVNDGKISYDAAQALNELESFFRKKLDKPNLDDQSKVDFITVDNANLFFRKLKLINPDFLPNITVVQSGSFRKSVWLYIPQTYDYYKINRSENSIEHDYLQSLCPEQENKIMSVDIDLSLKKDLHSLDKKKYNQYSQANKNSLGKQSKDEQAIKKDNETKKKQNKFVETLLILLPIVFLWPILIASLPLLLLCFLLARKPSLSPSSPQREAGYTQVPDVDREEFSWDRTKEILNAQIIKRYNAEEKLKSVLANVRKETSSNNWYMVAYTILGEIQRQADGASDWFWDACVLVILNIDQWVKYFALQRMPEGMDPYKFLKNDPAVKFWGTFADAFVWVALLPLLAICFIAAITSFVRLIIAWRLSKDYKEEIKLISRGAKHIEDFSPKVQAEILQVMKFEDIRSDARGQIARLTEILFQFANMAFAITCVLSLVFNPWPFSIPGITCIIANIVVQAINALGGYLPILIDQGLYFFSEAVIPGCQKIASKWREYDKLGDKNGFKSFCVTLAYMFFYFGVKGLERIIKASLSTIQFLWGVLVRLTLCTMADLTHVPKGWLEVMLFGIAITYDAAITWVGLRGIYNAIIKPILVERNALWPKIESWLDKKLIPQIEIWCDGKNSDNKNIELQDVKKGQHQVIIEKASLLNKDSDVGENSKKLQKPTLIDLKNVNTKYPGFKKFFGEQKIEPVKITVPTANLNTVVKI